MAFLAVQTYREVFLQRLWVIIKQQPIYLLLILLLAGLFFYLVAFIIEIKSTTVATIAWNSPAISSTTGSNYIWFDGDRAIYRYSLTSNTLDQINDPTDDSGAHSGGRSFYRSPDKKKLAVVNTPVYNDRRPYQINRLLIYDLTTNPFQLIYNDSLTPDDYLYYGLFWNDTSDGFLYIMRDAMGEDSNSNQTKIFDLKNKSFQTYSDPEKLCGPDVMKKTWYGINLAWSNSRNEIYCLHPGESKKPGDHFSYDSLVITSISNKTTQTIKFSPPMLAPATYGFTQSFSSDSNYLALGTNVYRLDNIAQQTDIGKQLIFSFKLDSGLECIDEYYYKCPIWSGDGKYVLYDLKKNENDRVLQMYDIKTGKKYQKELASPCTPSKTISYFSAKLIASYVGGLSNNGQIILKCSFTIERKEGDGLTRTQNLFFYDLLTGEEKPFPPELSKYQFQSFG